MIESQGIGFFDDGAGKSSILGNSASITGQVISSGAVGELKVDGGVGSVKVRGILVEFESGGGLTAEFNADAVEESGVGRRNKKQETRSKQ